MSDFFERNFPGVKPMLELEREQQNARESAKLDLPWKLMTLNLGRPEIHSSHATEEEADQAHQAVLRTCAPFIRGSFWVEKR